MIDKNKAEKGIIITGFIGDSYICELAYEHKDKLLARFPSYMVNKMLELTDTSTEKERKIAKKYNCSIFDMDKKGFLATLWNMAEDIGSGLLINVKKIPIRQETVEICEFFDLDPYTLPSKGSLMLVSENALQLTKELEDLGIAARIIGFLTKGKARILKNGERIRYLDKPR